MASPAAGIVFSEVILGAVRVLAHPLRGFHKRDSVVIRPLKPHI